MCHSHTIPLKETLFEMRGLQIFCFSSRQPSWWNVPGITNIKIGCVERTAMLHPRRATLNQLFLHLFFLSLWVLFCFLGVVLFPKIILFVDRFVMEANLWFFTSQLVILLVTLLIAVSVSLQVNSTD